MNMIKIIVLLKRAMPACAINIWIYTMNKKIISLVALSLTCAGVTGCLAAAAGAGAEAGYVASQEGRSASETINDQRITASVKTKLLADPNVSGLDINVDTFKGAVSLKGVVSKEREVTQAIQLAKSVSGVTSVTPKLVVMR